MKSRYTHYLYGAVALVAFSQSSVATTLVLDSTNNYSVSLGSGSISQLNWVNLDANGNTNGRITISGFTVAAGAPDVADFSSPLDLSGDVASLVGDTFTFQDDTTQELFQVDVTFFRSPRGGNSGTGFVGVAPLIDNTAGFAFNATQVPEPSTSILVGLTSLALLRRKRAA